ncbi:MAG: hypothetical protein ABL964_00545 [Steroidobacteraceae bacterium]
MYEKKIDPPLPRSRFLHRILLHGVIAAALLLASLGLGMSGYEYLEHLPWRDAFLNSAMLLGGMGPVDPPRTDAGKVFAGLYALYAGLVFLLIVGLVFTPVVHRLLHKFHWDQPGE